MISSTDRFNRDHYSHQNAHQFNLGSGLFQPKQASISSRLRRSSSTPDTQSRPFHLSTRELNHSARLGENGSLNRLVNHSGFRNHPMLDLFASQPHPVQIEHHWQAIDQPAQAVVDAMMSSTRQKQNKKNQSGKKMLKRTSATETAKPAAAFIDSIGVNTHLHYYDTAYGNFSMVEQRLKEAGIRHIRDGGSDPTWAERINQLGRDGIKSTIVIDPNIGVGPNASYDLKSPAYQMPQFVKDIVPVGAEAVEALNEFDISYQNGYSRNQKAVTGSDWVSYLRDFTQDTFNNVKGNDATKHIAVIGPSFVNSDSSTAIGDLSQWVDYGNMHPYNYPSYPEDGNLSRDMANRAKPFGNHPLIATEAGYHTGSAAAGRSVSETVQGKYIPRMFLDNFNHGVARTFSYELMDQKVDPNNGEANFGLLRTDGSPKPAFTAMKNLIGLLNDSSSSFTPRSLGYQLSGNTQNLQHTLLQKSNGDFYLVLWSGVGSTDQTSSQQVTLNLSTPLKKATTYLPNQSANVVKQYQTPTQIKLNVPDAPLVVKLTPQPSSR